MSCLQNRRNILLYVGGGAAAVAGLAAVFSRGSSSGDAAGVSAQERATIGMNKVDLHMTQPYCLVSWIP